MNKKIFNKYLYFMIFGIINILSTYIYNIYGKNDTYFNILITTSIFLGFPMLLYGLNNLFLLLNQKLYLITIILVFSIALIIIFINRIILKQWDDLVWFFIPIFITIIGTSISYLKDGKELNEIVEEEVEVRNKIYK